MQSSDMRLAATLRDSGPMTRQALQAATGLSLATVNRGLGRLLESGSVVVSGNQVSTGGRPPELLAFNGDGQVVAGVSVTDGGATALVASVSGDVVARHEVAFARADDPEARLRLTMSLLDRVVSGPPGRLIGVGVAVPGVVSGPGGTVTAIHELGWERLALGDLLTRQAGMAVTLANDADCLAVAEHRRGAGRGASNVVALVARNGLGAGLITNGQLYRGHNHEAGEVGYLLTGRQSLRRLFPDRGELEQLLGGERLRAEAARLGLGDRAWTLPDVIALGSDDASAAHDLAGELLDLVALAVSAICVVLDPDVLIIGGAVGRGMDQLIAGVRERLVGRILRVPRIEPAALGADAVMVGAALIANGHDA